MIRVVRGNPTPEELAAALAVVQARAAALSGATASGPRPPEGWSDPARIARSSRPLPGPRAWARSYWPV
ncbi:acyl-CoA carboxylase epsilon subunit [Streptomyces sp. NPDC003023]|uniref:acyl-CoA carboxylase epsilon subunit n=1 Tax=Streptomyces sp. NPDC003023 TaxID=3364675 RepID=UPI00368ABC06